MATKTTKKVTDKNKAPVAAAPVATPVTTAPPVPPKPQFPEVNMPCKRGKDLMTKGSSCDSKRAWNTSPVAGGKNASFKCMKCNYQWNVPMGGVFNGA